MFHVPFFIFHLSNIHCILKEKALLFMLFVCVLAISQASAQKPLHQALYDHAVTTPDSVTKNFRTLAAYLKAPCQDDSEIVETIFYWMALNIQYNDDPNYEMSYADSVAKVTLLTRKSGCEGTARLFCEICHAANVECQVVFGYAEGYSFDRQQSSRPNHGWNAVQINGEWKLVDATWGSGGSTTEGNQEMYVRELDLRYLFADPTDLIIDHFPEDSKWQLLENPITKREFYSDEYELKRLAKLAW
jgi:transglutaminase/protease-like cytokinesis protein 3